MRNLIFIITVLLSFQFQLQAQIRLIGAKVNQSSGGIDITTWNALDSSSVMNYATPLAGYYMASSVFDSYSSNYYLSGTTGLFSFNSMTYKQEIVPFSNFSNITEIDMSTGKIYNITGDSINSFIVNEYDIATGNDIILGTITEPGSNGIVADATGFDSNNGILFYLGFDAMGHFVLYSIPVREPVFTYSKTVLQGTPQNAITGLNYDNVHNLLFGLELEYNAGVSSAKIVEINTTTGEIISRGEIAGFEGYVAGSSSFDQFSGNFMLAAILTGNDWKMVAFDISTNTYVTGFIPDGVSEIVCDNYAYAKNAYGTTALQSKQVKDIQLYPNPSPSSGTIHFENLTGNSELEIFDLQGRKRFTGRIAKGQSSYHPGSLPEGIYIIRITDSESTSAIRFIIQ